MTKKIIFIICLILINSKLVSGVDLKIKDKTTEIYIEPDGPAAGVIFNNIIIEQMEERGPWVQARATFWVPKTMVNKIFLEEKEDITWDEVHKSPINYQDMTVQWICFLQKTGKTEDGQTKWHLLARNLQSKELKTRKDGLFFAYFDKQVEKDLKKYTIGDWLMITGKVRGAGTNASDEEFGYVIVDVSGVEKVVIR